MIGLLATRKYIFSRLVGDATLSSIVARRVYYDAAPEGAEFPFIVFQEVTSRDINGVGGVVVATRPSYLIKAVQRGENAEGLRGILKRIHLVITGVNPSPVIVDDCLVQGCRRYRTMTLLERDHDEKFLHVGGYYEFFTEENTL